MPPTGAGHQLRDWAAELHFTGLLGSYGSSFWGAFTLSTVYSHRGASDVAARMVGLRYRNAYRAGYLRNNSACRPLPVARVTGESGFTHSGRRFDTKPFGFWAPSGKTAGMRRTPRHNRCTLNFRGFPYLSSWKRPYPGIAKTTPPESSGLSASEKLNAAWHGSEPIPGKTWLHQPNYKTVCFVSFQLLVFW